jgi:hypothetical protein
VDGASCKKEPWLAVNADSVYEYFWKTFRVERISLFFSLLNVKRESTVLDVGGTDYFWKLAEQIGLPVPRVTILNLGERHPGLAGHYSYVRGDGRYMPFGDCEFDFVFSNSVIEHVGKRDEQRRFADEIKRVGRGYFVQTPDKRFPVEPHMLVPFIHWLPERIRTRIDPAFTIGGLLKRLTDKDRQELRAIKLLGPGDMRVMFPEARIIVERFCLLPKSIIAYRASSAA